MILNIIFNICDIIFLQQKARRRSLPAKFYKSHTPLLLSSKKNNSRDSSPRRHRSPSLVMSQILGSQHEKCNVHVEELKESIRQEIRKELKIKEGAENLRKVSTDKRTLSQCQNAIKESSQKLNELHEHLQDLNAHISEEVIIG